MKFKIFCLFAALFVFSNQSMAKNIDEWDYKTISGDLKPTAGCKDKAKAEKSASTGYRFHKYTTELCNQEGYGWGKEKVIDKGTLVCDACEGDYEGMEKYRCFMENVKIECKKVSAGW